MLTNITVIAVMHIHTIIQTHINDLRTIMTSYKMPREASFQPIHRNWNKEVNKYFSSFGILVEGTNATSIPASQTIAKKGLRPAATYRASSACSPIKRGDRHYYRCCLRGGDDHRRYRLNFPLVSMMNEYFAFGREICSAASAGHSTPASSRRRSRRRAELGRRRLRRRREIRVARMRDGRIRREDRRRSQPSPASARALAEEVVVVSTTDRYFLRLGDDRGSS